MTWKFEIDWERDYNYTGTYDDITADVVDADWSLGMTTPFQEVANEAVCNLRLKNTDGKYNPENTSSILAGTVDVGRRVRVSYVDGGTTTMWQGWLREVRPQWNPAGQYTGKTFVDFTCTGNMEWLKESEAPIGIQENKRTDEIIREILLQAPVTPIEQGVFIINDAVYGIIGGAGLLADFNDYANLEVGETTIPFYGDNSIQREIDNARSGRSLTAFNKIAECVGAERGRFFAERNGQWRFWSRNYLGVTSPTASGTITESGNVRPTALSYSFGSTHHNIVEVTPSPRATGSEQIIWTLATPITIPTGEKITLNAYYVDLEGQPTGATNVTIASTVSSGGSVKAGIRPRGDQARLTLDNSTGVSEGVVTSLTLSGQTSVERNRLTAFAEDKDSIETHGKTPTLRIDLPALDDFDFAQKVANFEIGRRGKPLHEISTVSFRGLTEQIDWKIGKRVNVHITSLGHNKDYYIMGERHSLSQGFKVHDTTFYLERASVNTPFIIGFSLIGGEDKLTF